jgi:hypothetical protein
MMGRGLVALLLLVLPAFAQTSPEKSPGSLMASPSMDGAEIVRRAHAAAGGPVWVRPKSLYLKGEGVFFTKEGAKRCEHYEMWRVFPDMTSAAHAANGRVRIEYTCNGKREMLLTFDGTHTYTEKGRMPPSDADKQWAENFGFGVIRYALDDGFNVGRLPDDLIDGRPAFVVRVTDPSGGETVFGIAQDNFQVLKVSFATPRGWHERIYSDFFTKPGGPWSQPSRVRLFYDGVKQNELFWKEFELGKSYPEDLFRVETPKP